MCKVHRQETTRTKPGVWLLRVIAATLGVLVWCLSNTARSTQAFPQDDNPNPRKRLIIVEYTLYEWWLATWANNELICQIYIEHEEQPTNEEILWACGAEAQEEWLLTETCPQATQIGGDLSQCDGLYLSLMKQTQGEREIWVELPSPTIHVTLSGCTPVSPENRCDSLPNLLLQAEDPLPNEHITQVHGSMDDVPFSCKYPTCELPLQPTGLAGVEAFFQADSSLGDNSPLFSAHIRVIEAPATETSPPGWYVDVLSTQWRGGPIASCSDVWRTFPPPGGPPAWLSTPKDTETLATDEPYVYLAGVLIVHGEVDASDCPNGGLLLTGGANACGLERALDKAAEWQNRFDEVILDVAEDTGVPAQLMKSLFARESQFWPGIFRSVEEAGLGQLTENGADTTLLWNESFFQEFCPLVLEETVCAKGYAHIEEDDQALLRGALFNRVNARCDECPIGIDMRLADYSIEVFAKTLLANCAQVGQMIWNTTGEMPNSSTYEDLWRLTIFNYNAGPGCLMNAIEDTWYDGYPMTWANVSEVIPEGCETGIDYVNDVSGTP